MNKRKVVVLLAAALFFTSLPFGNSYAYATVLKEEGVLASDGNNTPDEAVLPEADADSLTVNDDSGMQDDLLPQDESITDVNEEDGIIEDNDISKIPVQNDGLSGQESTDGVDVTADGTIDAEGKPVDGWFPIVSGPLKGVLYRFENGKLTVSGNAAPDDNTPWNTNVEEQGSPIPHGGEEGAVDITAVKSAEIHISGMKDLGLLFAGFINLEKVDFYGMDTENVRSVCGMFYGCSALRYVDISYLDLRNIVFGIYPGVGGFDQMFEGCSSLDGVTVAEESLPDMYYGYLITLPYDKDHVWRNERLSKFVGGIEKDPSIDSGYFGRMATFNTYERVKIAEASADTQYISTLMHQGAYVTIQLPTNRAYKSGNKIDWKIDKSGNKIAKLASDPITYKEGNILNTGCQVMYTGNGNADVEYAVVRATYGDKSGEANIRFINPSDYLSGSGCGYATASDNRAYDRMYISSLCSGQIEFIKGNDKDAISEARENGIPYLTWDADDNIVEDAHFEIFDPWVAETGPETMAEGFVEFTLKENASPGRTTVMTTLHVMEFWTGDEYSYYDYDVPFYIDIHKDASVSMPTASIASGTTVKYGTGVRLECATPGADIYYTFNDEPIFDEYGRPYGDVRLYNGPIKISESGTIFAAARLEGWKDSYRAEFDYTMYEDWGDIGEGRDAFNDDIYLVPGGIWFLIRDDDEWRWCESDGDTKITRPYTGTPININENVGVFCGTGKLAENIDYTVKYSDNINAGIAAMTVSGKGNFGGSAKVTFKISPVPMADATVRSGSVVTIEAGKSLDTFKPEVTFGDRKLNLNKDYECEYAEQNDTTLRPVSGKTKAEAGKEYSVSLNPKNDNFTGTKDKAFTIKVIDRKDKHKVPMSAVKVIIPKLLWNDLAGARVKVLFDNRKGKKSAAQVTNGKKALVYGTDFVLENEEAVIDKAGSYEIILLGTEGNAGSTDTAYVGSKKAVFTVTGIKASKVKVGGMTTEVEFKGRPLTLEDLNARTKDGYREITLYTENDKLINGVDYDAVLNNNYVSGKTEAVFTLKGKYEGTITKKIKVKAANIDGKQFSYILNKGAKDEVKYSKSGAVPSVRVVYNDPYSDNEIILKEGVDYTVSCKNNTKTGAATATVKGKGNYTGSHSVEFTVVRSSPDAIEVVADDKTDTGKTGNYKQVPKLMEGGKALAKGKDVDSLPGRNDWKYYIASTGEELFGNETVPVNTVIMVCADITIGPGSPYYNGENGEKIKATVKGCYRVIDKDHDISKATVTVDDDKWLEFNNGEELLPDNACFAVKIKSGNFHVLLGDNQYEVVSVEGNRLVGNATVILRGKGEYGGSKKIKVKVRPRDL